MERKLASIQKILKLEPIPNADAIEKATILGWSLVVKKGEFKVGDSCVYIEVDSILPERPEFEFLRTRHFRIKTIKLKGQVSQGIAFPLSILGQTPLILELDLTKDEYVGMDVTNILEIKKYEPYIPAHLAGVVKGNFPDFLRKTDETRIQSVPEVLERHKGKRFYVTEKLDGTSMTVYVKDGIIGVCSRNLELKEDLNNAYWKKALELKVQLEGLSLQSWTQRANICLQGELVGQGIQGNKYAFSDTQFFVFNIFDIDSQSYLNYNDMKYFAEHLGLKTVPVVDDNFVLNHTVDDLVKYVTNKSVYNNVQREGCVFRPHYEEIDQDLGRLSFKVINPEFLLRYGE